MAFFGRRTRRSAPITNGLHDPTIDPIANPRAIRTQHVSPWGLEAHQRLIVNPFLAVFGLLIWMLLFRFSVKFQRLDVFFGVVCGGILLVFLPEYHCLDCGQTGRLLNSKTHVCERVEIRSLDDGLSSTIWPSTHFQVVVWGFVLVIGAVFVVLSRW